jgi:hypothetical protein
MIDFGSKLIIRVPRLILERNFGRGDAEVDKLTAP